MQSMTGRKGRSVLGLTADQVASQLAYVYDQENLPSNGRRSLSRIAGQYLPNQSLYDGAFQPLSPTNSDDEHELDSPSSALPLQGSSLHNTRLQSRYSMQSTPRRQVMMPVESDLNIAGLIQAQQELLEKVLSNQQKMQERQDKFDRELATLSKQMKSSSSSPDSDVQTVRRYRICRELTRKVAAIHDSLEDGGFRQSEGSTSDYNKRVKSQIIAEICGMPDCKFEKEQVKAAVQRKYENIRRTWKLDENSESTGDDIRQSIAKGKKYRARRKRKHENRSVVVKPAEQDLWKDIVVDDMSEESDDPECPNNLVVHKLKWCSQELIDFKATLDKRYADKSKKECVLVARKNRIEGAPSNRPPRPDIPQWMLNPAWDDGSSTSSGERDSP